MRITLQKAASIASLIPTTEVLATEIKEKSAAPAGGARHGRYGRHVLRLVYCLTVAKKRPVFSRTRGAFVCSDEGNFELRLTNAKLKRTFAKPDATFDELNEAAVKPVVEFGKLNETIGKSNVEFAKPDVGFGNDFLELLEFFIKNV